MNPATRILWLAGAGALGTLARYGLGGLVQRLHGGDFPFGTMVVNLLGCFLFGLVWTLADERMVVGAETRGIVLVGFMGAFTTFSSFAFETGAMLRAEAWLPAAANVLVQNGVGLLALFLGFGVGRRF